jgi:hypothetical protein
MRNILALIGAAVLGFAVLGWYLQWYKVGTEPTSDGHRKVNIDFSTTKIAEDVKAGEQKVINALPTGDKGTTTTPAPEKKVQGQTTGFQFNPDGSVTIAPQYKNVGN